MYNFKRQPFMAALNARGHTREVDRTNMRMEDTRHAAK